MTGKKRIEKREKEVMEHFLEPFNMLLKPIQALMEAGSTIMKLPPWDPDVREMQIKFLEALLSEDSINMLADLAKSLSELLGEVIDEE